MRRNLLFIFLMTVLCLSLFSQKSNQREIYSFTYDGRNYEVVMEMKNWANAAAFAVERGGYLVEINDIDEQIAIYNAIINGAGVSPTYTSVSNGGGIAYVWIGATDQSTEGTWLWDGNGDNQGINFWNGQGANGTNNGTSVDGAFFNWGGTSTGTPEEPDNYNSAQDYAAIGLTGWPSGTTNLGIAGEWNDLHGSCQIYSVIEYNSGTGANENQINESLGINVFPNPTSAEINVTYSKSVKSIEIFNLRGQQIYKGLDNKIDLSFCKKGVYFLKATDGRKSLTKKVLLL